MSAMASDIASDPRFSHVLSDPRFKVRRQPAGNGFCSWLYPVLSSVPQTIPRCTRKVRIGSRFQSMFTSSKFKVKCKQLHCMASLHYGCTLRVSLVPRQPLAGGARARERG